MPVALTDSPTLRRYYAILTGGAEQYGNGQDLLPLLSDAFVFEGPIAGRVEGPVPFTHGAKGFVETVADVAFIQAVATPQGAAVLYDAELPAGTVRFSEFFEFDGARILQLRIQYNAGEYVAAGGR